MHQTCKIDKSISFDIHYSSSSPFLGGVVRRTVEFAAEFAADLGFSSALCNYGLRLCMGLCNKQGNQVLVT